MATLPPYGAPSPPTAGVPYAPPPRPRHGHRVLWLTLFIVFIALCGLGVLVYVGWHIGPLALGVGIGAAILPVPVLVGCFLWLDRAQPSPLSVLALCFGWGAGVATAVALAVNNGAAWLFEQLTWSDDLVGVFVAPFIEESMKALLPILLYLFARRLFAGVLDGVIFCGLSATGFAMVENILYLGGIGFAGASEEGGVAAGALATEVLFIARVVFTGFAHPLFTAMTGLGLGIGARSADRRVRVVAPIVGLLFAMMLHGSWNLMATLSGSNQFIILYGYFSFFMPIFLAMVGVVLWLRSWEGRLAERVLPVYVTAGWFTPPEVAALGTLGRRLSAQSWAKRVAGDVGRGAMRGYQLAAGQLAMLRDSMNRGLYRSPADLAKAAAEEQRLLATVDAYRKVFVGRDPVTPPAWWDGGGYQIWFPDGVRRPVPAPPLPVVPVPFVLPRS